MVIDVTGISKQPGAVKEFVFDEPFANIAYAEDQMDFEGPVHVQGTVMNIGEGVYDVEVVIDCDWISECARCLDRVSVPVTVELKERFIRDAGEEDDAYPFSNDSLILDAFVRDGILLDLPSQVFCRADCKGLCPVCGQNLNNNPQCSCSGAGLGDHRLSALAALLNSDDEEV